MNSVLPEFITGLRDGSVFAPELPQSDAFEVFESIRRYEKELIMSKSGINRELQVADYAEGSAEEEDELRILNLEHTGVLASADHATDPMRKGQRIGADHGTAGLLAQLTQGHDVTGIVPVGLQTGNAAVTPNHPVKIAMAELLPSRLGFVSLHGMRPGKLLDTYDKTEIHGLIGLGSEPNEISRAVAERLTIQAKDLGLRVLIGNDTKHLEYDPHADDLLREADSGTPLQGQLAAFGKGTTTNYANAIMRDNGMQIPAFQIELTRLLRLQPSDFEQGWHRDPKARAMGVYMGYLLACAAVDLVKKI